jgi:putative Mn2+ efflux pump MntP
MLQTLIIAFGLSTDAFAASIAKGARFPGMSLPRVGGIALGFASFEALAPLIGFLLGSQFASVIEDVDHWIAFGLLGLLGGRMVWKSFHAEPEEQGAAVPTWSAVVVTALGTSIDAIAVGITLALLSDNIPLTLMTIGLVTFAMTFVGLRLGGLIGARTGRIAEFAGGIGLALVGVNILITHLTA